MIPVETGCYIDGSHMSNIDFMVNVIRFAADHGFELDLDRLISDYNVMDYMSHSEYQEIMDSLDWTYDGALDYLNENTSENFYWVVQEQSLFLEDADENL